MLHQHCSKQQPPHSMFKKSCKDYTQNILTIVTTVHWTPAVQANLALLYCCSNIPIQASHFTSQIICYESDVKKYRETRHMQHGMPSICSRLAVPLYNSAEHQAADSAEAQPQTGPICCLQTHAEGSVAKLPPIASRSQAAAVHLG